MAKKKEPAEPKEVRKESAGVRLKNEHLTVFIEGDRISGILLDNRSMKARLFTAEMKEV